MDWQNSINPFYTTNHHDDISLKPKLINPLKIDTTNLIFNSNNPSPSTTATAFKPIPLPDDILGFDPLPMDMNNSINLQQQPQQQQQQSQQQQSQQQQSQQQQSQQQQSQQAQQVIINQIVGATNISFDLENYLKSDLNTELEVDDIDNDFLDANILSKEKDIEKVLLDLGISEIPIQNQSNPELNNNNHNHKRKLSGSGIFGFVGQGENTQLQIPGIEPVLFSNKKPLYKDITNFDNLNYNNLIIPSTPPKSQPIKKEKPDYYIPSGNPKSYKFPPSPPKGIFDNQSTEIQSQSINQIQKQKQINNNISRSTSPLRSVAMSSPLKNLFQTPKLSSPNKLIPLSQLKSQNQFQVKLNKQLLKESDDTTMIVADDDKDQTISAINTPLKSSKSLLNDYLQTPTKTKFMKNWDQSAVQIKNQIFQERIKSPKKSPTRKKPTITSTLATGTLDKYFIGPIKDGDETKFICKFFDKEIQEPCNREFTRISNARAHIQTHLSDRPFVCQQCNKAFVRNHDLRRHQKGHETTASNVCPCGKRFPRADALKRHRMRNICIGGFPKSVGISKPHDKESNIQHNLNENNKLKGKIIENMNNSKIINTPKSEILSLPIKSQTTKLIQKSKLEQFQNSPQINSISHQFNDRPLSSNNLFNTSTSKDIDLFDFNEMSAVDGNFSFNMDDSLVI
ncbi:hypothetical protein C6P40_004105 [Pichia californica]|uniref:C2H2-type domain-containing protein n=1 Tax=Pichia californica TaxID=460514 RepID=A0A9P6WQK3_9ASCO|nr:hypothetical protein C6P40_004105 [[Candida] californica]